MKPIRFHFELRNSAPGRNIAALYLEFPEDAGGIRYVSFYQTIEEWIELFKNGGLAQDGYHFLTTFDECFTFFNFEAPRPDNSVASVPYARITLPRAARNILIENLGFDRQALVENPDARLTQNYTEKYEEWNRIYGRGKGKARVVASPEIADRLGAARSLGGESFARSWSSIERMALATTNSIDDVAEIRIYPDGTKSFGWSAGGMHGGLINHGTEAKPDWSVHT